MRLRTSPRLCGGIAATLAVTLASGCGLQSGAATGPVSLTLTHDYGSARVGAATVAHPPAGATALQVLKRRFKVALGPNGSVHAIGGVVAGRGDRWQLYLNGVAARPRARIHTGERLWWDLEGSVGAPRAVVGSFPEPFLHGLGGKRLPTTLQCGRDVAAACRHVEGVLSHAGISAASQLLGAGSGQDSLAVVIGTWRDIRNGLVAALLRRGPTTSGVFARFTGAPNPSLRLLNAHGTVVVTAGPGAGLIAALTQGGAPPTWLLVGTDPAGATAAAEAFSASRLRDHFALAVSGGHDVPLPR